jgi:hypothetical protein
LNPEITPSPVLEQELLKRNQQLEEKVASEWFDGLV